MSLCEWLEAYELHREETTKPHSKTFLYTLFADLREFNILLKTSHANF
jgi:hypothetical protein